MSETADAVFAASVDGLAGLRRLGSADIAPQAFDEALAPVLSAREVARLRRYVGARVRLARRGPRRAITGLREFGAAVWRGVSGEG